MGMPTGQTMARLGEMELLLEPMKDSGRWMGVVETFAGPLQSFAGNAWKPRMAGLPVKGLW